MASRLERIAQTQELEGKRIVVTGCGYTPLKTRFYDVVSDEETHDPLFINEVEMKLNMGAATAAVLAKKSATIHMVSKTPEKLKKIKNYMTNRLNIKNKSIEYSSVDLMNEPQTRDFASSLPVNFPIYWFHCVGLSSGNYFLPGSGNRWLPFEQLTRKHFESEVIPFWVSTTNVAKSLWPKFKEQNGTKIVLVSSMSATRSYIFGASHCPAEAAMDRLASVLSLEAYKNKIWITTLRAGAIDTGTYDENDVQDSIKKIVREYGANWDDGLKLAPPSSVGEAAACAFASSAHLSVISLISQGQFPHESS